MARLKTENHARRYLAVFLGLAVFTALLRVPGAGYEAFVVAIGTWAAILATIYRQAMADRRAPRADEDAVRRQVVPTLIAAVFWLFGFFFGLIALGLAWKYKRTLEKAPASVRQQGALATLLSLLEGGSSQESDAEGRRVASADPWEALEAAEREAKKAVVREAEPQAIAAAPPTAAPAFVETVVPAAEAPALPPLPDLFARSATEPVSSHTASTDPLGEFKNPSSGFDEVLAMLQGKPSSSQEDSNA